MNRKNYKRPTMQVVQFQHEGHILIQSNEGSAGVQNYEVEESQEW